MEVAGRERFYALGRDRGSAVEELKLRNYCAGVEHRRIYRPWGYYQDMGIAARYRVKRIVVKPGSTLSLEKHFHRSEHWVVVKGTAEIIASRQDGQPGDCRFLATTCIFWTAIYVSVCFEIEIRVSKKAMP